MANRFYDSYRPQHDGQSVFGNGSSGQKPPSDYIESSRGWGGSDPYPKGGSSVSRKPKPKFPTSSGGMALPLPIPQKVK